VWQYLYYYIWKRYYNRRGQEMYSEEENVENNKKHNTMYCLFKYLKYGNLGKGNRIPIPICVIEKIREMFPIPDDNYMDYMSN
jgi:hypothetical protein